MANSTETITLEILAKDLASGNISTFIGHVDQAAKKGGMLGSVFQGVGQHMGSSIASMIDPTRIITAQLDAAADASMKLATGVITGAIEGQLVQANLEAALQANIKNWDGNTAAIDDTSRAAQGLAFVNDDVEKSMASLVVHTKDLNTALAIMPVAEDLARAKHISLTDASNVLGKAFDGSTGALARMGIKLDKGAKGMDAIKDAAKAVGGQAKQTASTFVGQMGVMGAAISNTQENIGTKLMPVLTEWITKLNEMLGFANQTMAAAGYTELGPYDVTPQGSTGGNRHPHSASWYRHHGHAMGGVIGAGDWGIVGENGPEMIYNAGGGGIGVVPNGGAGVHVHFHSAYPPSPMEGERIAQALAPHLRREMTRIGA